MGEMSWPTLPLGYQQFLPAPPAASFPSFLSSCLPCYPTLLSLFCADWRWLPLACSRSGGVCEKGHKPSSGLGLVFTTPCTQLQAGETCLTGWFGMRLLALAACLTTIACAPAACGIAGGRNARILHCRMRSGRGLFAMAERHADQCKCRCGLLKPLG